MISLKMRIQIFQKSKRQQTGKFVSVTSFGTKKYICRQRWRSHYKKMTELPKNTLKACLCGAEQGGIGRQIRVTDIVNDNDYDTKCELNSALVLIRKF